MTFVWLEELKPISANQRVLFVLNSTGFQEGRKDDKIESWTQTALEGIFDIPLHLFRPDTGFNDQFMLWNDTRVAPFTAVSLHSCVKAFTCS